MHTFRKLPKHSPRAKIAASRKGSTSAKYPVCLDLDDYKPLPQGILSTKVSVLLRHACRLQVIVRKEETVLTSTGRFRATLVKRSRTPSRSRRRASRLAARSTLLPTALLWSIQLSPS